MKLKNTTDFPDRFLRRMVSWCCRQLELPVRFVQSAQFRQRREHRFSGHAYHWQGGGRIVVSIAPDAFFPWTDEGQSPGIKGLVRTYADRTECLVGITAHELRHLLVELTGERTRRRDYVGSSERQTEWDAQQILKAFRAERDALVAAWMADAVRPAKPRPTAKERNAVAAERALQRWQRKLKLAQTKVRKYKAAVRRYEKQGVLAATGAK